MYQQILTFQRVLQSQEHSHHSSHFRRRILYYRNGNKKRRKKNNQISSKREERRARSERETDLNSFNSGDISSGHVGPLTVSATHGDKATLSDVCTDVPFARSLDQISRMIAARFCFVLLRLRWCRICTAVLYRRYLLFAAQTSDIATSSNCLKRYREMNVVQILVMMT